MRYRIWQFWQILWARPLSENTLADVRHILTASEFALFQRFDCNDQQHSVRVLQMLQDAGHVHPDLWVAALLHDVGKTKVRISIWQRSFIVLSYALSSERIARWGVGEAVGWKRPFVVKAQHPAWGAEMAEAAGATPLAVALIRRHQDVLGDTAVSEEDQLLRALQWADDQN